MSGNETPMDLEEYIEKIQQLIEERIEEGFDPNCDYEYDDSEIIDEIESYYDDLYNDYLEAYDEWNYTSHDALNDMQGDLAEQFWDSIRDMIMDGPTYGS